MGPRSCQNTSQTDRGEFFRDSVQEYRVYMSTRSLSGQQSNLQLLIPT